MAVNVETLEKLERKITLSLPVDAIQKEVETRLKNRGWKILGGRSRSDSQRGHTMSEIYIEKEGLKLDLVSQLWEDADVRGYKGYVTNSVDDDCEFFNDLESIGFSHESALCGLISQLP